ncbi:hypothetical protein PMI01_02017 [Caulobacter sp. AP07]|uniref:hypothetical protein n=1 Tax=Caulobacter sp. AP07 TaxID=1144304 RepID=UPI00027206BB|nr:hypothetical protein [Caulobacter sp. AP07]EJL33712.1 hypothetical protein PMI01_02017 [Caulobacter sp. AP07]
MVSPNAADLETLETLSDGKARNALALRLAESKTPRLAEVLIRMIGRPDLRNDRGTLVHALGHYDCSDHLNFLVDLVIDGGWEVAHEAFQIIDLIETVEGDDAERALASTTMALSKVDIEDWRRELFEDILDMFE